MVVHIANTLQGIEACPHCGVANPGTALINRTPIHLGDIGRRDYYRTWAFYNCTTCLMAISACTHIVPSGRQGDQQMRAEFVFPHAEQVSEYLPDRPRAFLADAIGAVNAPSASIMAACSCIDAMLTEKKFGRYQEGGGGNERSLKQRIDLAVEANVLTRGMSEWAHKIRLDANAQRHADPNTQLPNQENAREVIKLAKAIAELLFVIPAEIAAAPEPEAP